MRDHHYLSNCEPPAFGSSQKLIVQEVANTLYYTLNRVKWHDEEAVHKRHSKPKPHAIGMQASRRVYLPGILKGQNMPIPKQCLIALVVILCVGGMYSQVDALKLVTYEEKGESRLGALLEDTIVDLNRAYARLLQQRGHPHARAIADVIVPPHMLGFLRGENSAREAANEAMIFAQHHPPAELQAARIVTALTAVQLRAPLPQPTKITGIGLNYRAHAEEMETQVPAFPLLFGAYPSAVIGPHDSIVIPKGATQVDYEAELGIVIGKRGKHVPREKARDYIAGYLIINDVTERGWQERTSQFLIGKTPDTFKPLGPYLVTADEIPDPQNLTIKLWVNDELRQDANTKQQVFSIGEVIAYISGIWTIEPGDVIATGTPPGVGHRRVPPVYLKAGDRVRVEITGLGVLESSVVAEP